jgi:hypothetical protein
LKKPITKKGWWSGSKCNPEFKPQYHKKKKERKKVWFIYTMEYYSAIKKTHHAE